MASSSSSLPDWALIDPFIIRKDDDSFPADDPTEASCTNSRGEKFRICFELHDPPRPSRLYLSWPAGTGEFDRFDVVAAHRDAVLFQMVYPVPEPRRVHPDMYDYFLYRTVGGAPSLHGLPSVYGTVDEFRALLKAGAFSYTEQILRRLERLDIAVLRRGEKEVAVAELQIIRSGDHELHVIYPSKSTSSRWKVKKPLHIYGHGPELDLEEFLREWCADTVIPFKDYLCWVDYCQGAALLCKVFDDTRSPELRYLALPAKPPGLIRHHYGRSQNHMHMTLSADEASGVLKYVLITGSNGMMLDSRHNPGPGFIAATWTLQIREGNEMVWAAGDVVTSEDNVLQGFFAQLPCGPLQYPHFSLSNPNIVYFLVKRVESGDDTKDNDAWIVTIDMPKKTLVSSFQYIKWEEDLSPDEYTFIEVKSDFDSFISTEFPKSLKLNGTIVHTKAKETRILTQQNHGFGEVEQLIYSFLSRPSLFASAQQ